MFGEIASLTSWQQVDSHHYLRNYILITTSWTENLHKFEAS